MSPKSAAAGAGVAWRGAPGSRCQPGSGGHVPARTSTWSEFGFRFGSEFGFGFGFGFGLGLGLGFRFGLGLS